MATYDAAWCLDRFNRLAGRPSTDAITPATKYGLLTDAQNALIGDLAAICPHVLYPTVGYAAIPTLTTTDQQTFTFGTDSNGYAITPLGKVGIFASLNDIPSNPWLEGRDYLALGGTAIQIPDNRTYSGTLYWRGIANPPDISATSQPVLFPEAARELIPLRAVYDFAGQGNRDAALADVMALRYGYPLTNAPGRFAFWCAAWKTQFQSGGALQTMTGRAVAVGSASNVGF